MKRYRVICLEQGGSDVVPAEEVEGAINKNEENGWSFVQLSTGGGGESELFNMWVYLVFSSDRP